MYRLKITGNRYKDNPVCPCGKSNKDYKFTPSGGVITSCSSSKTGEAVDD